MLRYADFTNDLLVAPLTRFHGDFARHFGSNFGGNGSHCDTHSDLGSLTGFPVEIPDSEEISFCPWPYVGIDMY